MSRKKLSTALANAVVRGKAKLLASTEGTTQPIEDPFIAKREYAKQWIATELPTIVEEVSAEGLNSYCLGWCGVGEYNKAFFLAEACENAGLTIIKNTLRSPKIVDPEKKNLDLRRDDLLITEFFTVVWDDIEV